MCPLKNCNIKGHAKILEFTVYLHNYLGHENTYNAHVPLLPLPIIYPAYSAINALIYYVYYVPINFQPVT